jgi:hypothetical protein
VDKAGGLAPPLVSLYVREDEASPFPWPAWVT